MNKKDIQEVLNHIQKCPKCNGSGEYSIFVGHFVEFKCDFCNGKGYVCVFDDEIYNW